MSNRRRRSVLFAPAWRADVLAKMARCQPDVVVLDLEDATPPEAKSGARDTVLRALEHIHFGGAERVVRINARDSQWAADDAAWLRDGRPDCDAVLLPKVGSLADIDWLEDVSGGRRPVWVLPTETAHGVMQLQDTLGHAAVTAVIWGAEDLAADIGAAGSRQVDGELHEVFRVVRSLTLLAAKAAGVDPIDTTYTNLRDLEGLRAEAERGRDMGFVGKAAIHPSHITVINAVYSPSDEEVAAARRLIEAFESAGGGAIAFEGRMVDAPHYRQALRLLQRASVATRPVS